MVSCAFGVIFLCTSHLLQYSPLTYSKSLHPYHPQAAIMTPRTHTHTHTHTYSMSAFVRCDLVKLCVSGRGNVLRHKHIHSLANLSALCPSNAMWWSWT